MASHLHDLTLIHNDETIHGKQWLTAEVRDSQNRFCPSSEDWRTVPGLRPSTSESSADVRFVQNKDRSILEQHPLQSRCACLWPAGEFDPPFPPTSAYIPLFAVAVLKPLEEVKRLRLLGGPCRQPPHWPLLAP